ncbi:hypothetical protein OHB54_45785 [Streptomyces sp. NBC_01007]|nr:hypothetical protein OHB54_45785 [Streptomyces sp. NBC_01007]
MPPALVGRTRPADVVLTATSNPTRWLLTPDLNHPILFDHHNDHLPGMVLLEGARQAATAHLAPHTLIPANASTTFIRYAELDRPCWIDITHTTPETNGTTTIEITATQDTEPVFTTTITGPLHQQ